MPTAQPPVCLLLSRPVTVTSLMMDLTLSPNRDAPLPPSSHFWIDHTGKGTCQPIHLHWYWRDREWKVYLFFISFFPFRQKVCCGIVYKGRFGEVIIDPRLFKPCCSSKKQTLGSTQVATRLPDTLPQQLQEDVKENWWLLLLNPPAGLSMASAWHCLQWQTSMFLFLQWNVRFFFFSY